MYSLADTLERQRELQDKLEYKPTRGELVVALVAELGEFLNAVKGKWAWWKRHGDAFVTDKERATEELADVLHFALALVLKDGRADGTQLLYEDVTPKDMPDTIRHILAAAGSVRFSRRVPYLLLRLGEEFGIERDDVLKTYFEKANVNEERWESARPKRRRKKKG